MTRNLSLFSRAVLTAFVALAAVLGPALGPLAVQGQNWPARGILLAVLLGLWCSGVAAAPARLGWRRRH